MPTPGRPVDPDRWLNVGCGDVPAPAPWVNCDIWPGVAPDVVMDCTRSWPFPPESVARVFLGQVIEHLDYPLGVVNCLRQARRTLARGGRLVIITPDADAITEKKCGPDILAAETAGMGRWPGDEHRWLPRRMQLLGHVRSQFPRAYLVNHLALDGTWPAGSRNPWDCCVVAGK